MGYKEELEKIKAQHGKSGKEERRDRRRKLVGDALNPDIPLHHYDSYQAYKNNPEELMKFMLLKSDVHRNKGNYPNAITDLGTAYARMYSSGEVLTSLPDEKKKTYKRMISRRLLGIVGVVYDDEKVGEEKRKKIVGDIEEMLEQIDAGVPHYPIKGVTIILAGLSILASLFFFSFNFTGNAVANLSASDGNILGAVFFVAGIVGTFLYFKRKR